VATIIICNYFAAEVQEFLLEIQRQDPSSLAESNITFQQLDSAPLQRQVGTQKSVNTSKSTRQDIAVVILLFYVVRLP
jgi:hypothetical protein